MGVRVFILLPVIWLLAGCSMQFAPYQRGPSPAAIEAFAAQRFEEHEREKAFVYGIFDAVRNQNRDALVSYLSPAVIRPTLERDLTGFYGNFPTRAPARVDMVSFQSNLNQQTGAADTLTLKVEYVFVYETFDPVLLTVTGEAAGAGPLQAVNVRSQTLNPYHWSAPGELGTQRQIVRALAIASPLTLILAFSLWIAVAGRIRRRAIWLVALLSTTPTFVFNWSTRDWSLLAPAFEKIDGIWRFEAVEWIVTGVQVSRTGDYHPWLITIGLPIGALWFLFKLASGSIERRPQLAPAPSRAPADNGDEGN